MVAIVGGVGVDLRASSAAFTRDMNKASKALAQNSTKMKRSLRGINKGFAGVGKGVAGFAKRIFSLRAAIGTLAGSAGFGLAIKEAAIFADTIAKTSDAIGISTDALQEYRFAAGLAGVETEAMDGAFKAFVKRVGELKVGTGTLTTFLDKSNQELKRQVIASRDSATALDLIFDAMANVEDETKRAALAAAAFGRTAGVDMTNMIKNGTAAMLEAREQAHDLGGVIREDLTRNAEAMNDEFLRLGTALKGQFRSAILEMAPLLTTMATKLLEVAGAVGEFFGSFVDLGDKSQAQLEEFIEDSERELFFLTKALDDFADPDRFDAMLLSLDKIFGNNDLIENTENRWRALSEEIATAKARLEEFKDEQAARDLANLPVIDLGGAGNVPPPDLDAFNEAMRERNELQREFSGLVEGTRTEVERVEAKLVRLEELGKRGFASAQPEEYRRVLEALNLELAEAIQNQKDHADAATEGMAKAEEAAERVGEEIERGISGALSDAITGAEDFGDAMTRVLNRVLEQLIDVAFSTEGLFGGGSSGGGGIFGSIFGFLGGLLGGGGGGSALVGSFIPQAFPASFEHGGEFDVGGSAQPDSNVVAFRATAGEHVTVSDGERTRRGGGGVVFIDARAADKEALLRLEAAIRATDASIEHRSLAVVFEEMQRNPQAAGLAA